MTNPGFRYASSGLLAEILRITTAAQICRYKYAIEVKHNAGIPYRTYIWPGADANTDGQPDWRFAYGEREWIGGSVFDDVKIAARGDALALPPVNPIGRVDCNTGAALP